MKKVQVLMSTYNGEKYLEQQIGSLADQQDVELLLSVRDDGSSDRTMSILSKLSGHSFRQLSIVQGSNIGVKASFFDLLQHASADADYYSFCDQDDVWKPKKLSRAVAALNKLPVDTPAMYCSSTELVDGELRHLAVWPLLSRRGASFLNAVIENIAVGCTVVINRAAKNLVLSRKPDLKRLIMHDWWIYLCVSAFGVIFFDPEPSILYRQHTTNAMGGDPGGIRRWARRWSSFKKNYNKRLLRRQAEEFFRLFGPELSEAQQRELQRFLNCNASFPTRIKYAASTKLYRQSRLDNLLFRILYLMNRI